MRADLQSEPANAKMPDRRFAFYRGHTVKSYNPQAGVSSLLLPGLVAELPPKTLSTKLPLQDRRNETAQQLPTLSENGIGKFVLFDGTPVTTLQESAEP